MSKYYYLIAGLPDIALDDAKPAYSVATFKTEIAPVLSEDDRNLLSLFYQAYDNRNLLRYLQKKQSFDDSGNLSFEDMDHLFTAIKNGEPVPANKRIPPYFASFIEDFLQYAEKGEMPLISWEDQLSGLYYDQALKCPNSLMASWFELNLNTGNILTAVNCRKYGLDKAGYIVGHNDVAELIRTSGARDFGLGDTVDYLSELLRIAEEPDLMMRERKTDLLKWNWLDGQTFFRPFDFEHLFAYLLRIEMIERWAALDKATGERTFREMLGAIKRESAEVLDKFRENNIK
jgi:hypothetical protein